MPHSKTHAIPALLLAYLSLELKLISLSPSTSQSHLVSHCWFLSAFLNVHLLYLILLFLSSAVTSFFLRCSSLSLALKTWLFVSVHSFSYVQYLSLSLQRWEFSHTQKHIAFTQKKWKVRRTDINSFKCLHLSFMFCMINFLRYIAIKIHGKAHTQRAEIHWFHCVPHSYSCWLVGPPLISPET